MGYYIIRRTIQAIPLLIGISLVGFILLQLAPGGPTAAYFNPKLSPEQMTIIRHNLGLDQPVHIQYWRWLSSLVTGDWGYSFTSTRPVLAEILTRVPNTLLLMATAFLLSILAALPLGVLSARRRYSQVDHFVTGFSFFGMSMPVFWFGMVLILIFSETLQWLPVGGMASIGEPFSLVDRLRHLAMPVTVLALVSVASYSRYLRASLSEVLALDYIRTARAKGLAERTVLYKHALRNALIPLVTVAAIDLPMLFSGAVITETIFSWPGIGRLYYDSVSERNYPILMAVLMITAFLVVLANLLADIIYAWLDPRITYE